MRRLAWVLLAAALAGAVGYCAGFAAGYSRGHAAGREGRQAVPFFDTDPERETQRMITVDRNRLAAEEAARRGRLAAATPRVPDVLAGAFPQQRACLLDPSPFKAEFCTRRAAKTYTWGLEAIHDSLTHPRARYLFLGLVRDEARSMFWVDVLQDVHARYPHLEMRFNEARLEVAMPNGATIRIGSADANAEEMRKLLGLKYRKVAIDEAQDWHHTDLHALVFETLKPACADWRGSVTLMGTPGRVAKGLFFDVTQRREPGWSVHSWTTVDNPYIRENWLAEIADLKARFPGIEDTPAFQRNYLGRWVIDESNLVYRYRPGFNDFAGALPADLVDGRWHHVLGVDLGYEDDSAFVLVAWHGNSPTLWVVEAHKQKKMDVTAVAERIKWYLRRAEAAGRPIETVVVDGSNKQAVAEMQNRHALSLVPSDKAGKSDFIEIMNAEFTTGRIKVDPAACRPLAEEYGNLVWKDKSTKREEHPAVPNHACDAALYAWRFTHSYSSRPVDAAPAPGTPAWAEAEGRRMLDRARAEVDRARVAQSEQFGPVEHEPHDPSGGWGGGYEWS